MINTLSGITMVHLLEKLQIVDEEVLEMLEVDVNEIINEWLELKEKDTNLITIYESWKEEGYKFNE